MYTGGRKLERIGETCNNIYGSKMTIIEYNNAHDMIVVFENGYKVKAEYKSFQKRNIVSLYDKTLYDVGYLGQGKYTPKDEFGNVTIQYDYWFSMIRRCYDKKILNSRPTYNGCLVCEEWHNFQNFAKWFDDNYYEYNNEEMHLDKDILHKGNKIYSPENCLIVPERINTLFVKNNANRGKYPIGVSYHKKLNKFQANCSILWNGKHKNKYLGIYFTPKEAYEVYKNYKENYIKEIADNYKEYIPEKLYNALYEYRVEITD